MVKADPADLQVGDPLTYSVGGTVVTHRIIEVVNEGTANLSFRTQGDANKIPDGMPVTAANVIGKPVFTVPLLGYLSDYIQHPPGTFIVLGGIVLLILLFFIPDLLQEDKQKAPSTESGQDP